ncbi:sigma-70 family RNA polymerase sigma factor [Nannocystaceae bacterium ST9]
MDAALHQRLLAALPVDLASAFADPNLEAELAEALVRTQRSLDFPVDEALFVAALAGAMQTPDDLASLSLADLVLARACADHHAGALRFFERTLGPELDRAIARSPTLGLSKPEFRQLALVRLFVHEPPRAAKIASYQGRGSLRAWLRVMVTRLIIDLSRRRSSPAEPGDPDLLDALAEGPDPELDYLRQRYEPRLRAALAAGIEALEVRQRNLLRQRYIHELSVDALARLYAVHRSTLYVWLEQARVALLQRAREELAAELPADRLESVIRMMGSQLEISVQRVLSSKLETEV